MSFVERTLSASEIMGRIRYPFQTFFPFSLTLYFLMMGDITIL